MTQGDHSGDDSWKSFDLLFSCKREDGDRLGERKEDLIDEMNDCSEVERQKQIDHMWRLLELIADWAGIIPRNDISEIKKFSQGNPEYPGSHRWMGLVFTDQSGCLTDPAPDLPLKGEFRLRNRKKKIA